MGAEEGDENFDKSLDTPLTRMWNAKEKAI